MLLENEKLEPLGGGVRIIVSDEHKFWTDTVLLANFSMPKKTDKVCDLGSGCGPIPLIWLRSGCSDLRELRGKVQLSSYDAVVCNPPYKAIGSGIKSSGKAHLIARHESMCTINDIAAAAKSLLRFSGRFFICQRPERLCDVLEAMRENDIEPKRLRFVQQRNAKAPKLFLVEGRRGGKPGGLIVEPVLFIEDENGNFSHEMIEIYGQYKEDYL